MNGFLKKTYFYCRVIIHFFSFLMAVNGTKGEETITPLNGHALIISYIVFFFYGCVYFREIDMKSYLFTPPTFKYKP